MNSTAHMIQDEWLLSYAAGNLTPGRSLIIASHAAFHDPIQEKIADAESIGGALLERASPADVDEALLERLMDRLDDTPAQVIDGSAAGKSAPNGKVFPPALADYIGADVDELDWRFMGPGMHNVRLWNGPNDERLWLLRARGGVAVPEHGHSGDEWTLILKGSYQTEFGRYSVGDMDLSGEEVVHQPVIDDGEECICLVMTDGPIRFKSVFARMVQPLIGL